MVFPLHFSACTIRAGALCMLGAIAGVAQAGALVCSDLSGIPQHPAVDYAAEIQPLFDRFCTGCHGGTGGLTLDAQSSHEQLVCAETQTASSPEGSHRVVPRAPNDSWLFLRLACDDLEDEGFRMPQFSTALTSSEQRLIFDWIAQGAYASNETIFDSSFEPISCQ